MVLKFSKQPIINGVVVEAPYVYQCGSCWMWCGFFTETSQPEFNDYAEYICDKCT